MAVLDFAKLAEAPVSDEPFRHVLVPNFVLSAQLPAVIRGLPRMTKGGSFPVGSLRLSDEAAALMTELEGARFKDCVAGKLGLDLNSASTMITLRGQSREKDGRIHRDSDAKLITILLYLNQDSQAWAEQHGCLRLLRSSNDINDFSVEISPVGGNLLIFPNGPTTWHGHQQYVGQRYVVQLNYMSDGAAARSEIRRHRISAVLKKLSAI